jgi:Pyruvate/2-oxoacid:ferredoxin oxidoreductase gamma subunit
MVKNTVALGATVAATKIFPVERFVDTMEEALKNNCALLPINREAFNRGMEVFETLNETP